jgi:hypothetical protein
MLIIALIIVFIFTVIIISCTAPGMMTRAIVEDHAADAPALQQVQGR